MTLPCGCLHAGFKGLCRDHICCKHLFMPIHSAPCSVVFTGEEGVDAGGVTREWYSVRGLILALTTLLWQHVWLGGPNSA